MIETVKEYILPLLFSSGILYMVIKSALDRKRNKAETDGVKKNTDAQYIENSMRIEKIAVDRYISADEKLRTVEALLAEVRKELEAEREYILVLRNFIRGLGAEPPERPEFQ